MENEQRKCACGTTFSPSRPDITDCRECRRTRFQDNASARRKQRDRQALGSHTEKQWFDRITFQNSRCFYCFAALLNTLQEFCGTKDHVVPISRGGTHFIENIVAACWPCNRRKGQKTASEFLATFSAEKKQFSEVCTLLDPTTFTNLAGQTTESTGYAVSPLAIRDGLFNLSKTHSMRETDDPGFWQRRRETLMQQARSMGVKFLEASGQMQLSLDMPSSPPKPPQTDEGALTFRGMHVTEKNA